MKLIQIFLMIIFIPTVAFSFTGKGVGTEEDPYQITNINQMQEVQNDRRAYYIIMNDIDASETRTWNVGDHDNNPDTPDEPMGYKPFSFHGYFDGNGHVISNLFINRPREYYVGLFGHSCFADIKKVGLENCDVTGKYFVGGMCGCIECSKIEECYTTGKIKSTDTSCSRTIGGFVGINTHSQSTIRDCYSTCSVSSASKKDYGAAAFCFGTRYPLTNAMRCYATGKVSSSGKACVFGIDNNAGGSFWDVETTGIPDPGDSDAKGLTTSEMMKRESFRGWEFDGPYERWCIDEGKDYPKLRVFGDCPPTAIGENTPPPNEFSIHVFPNPAIGKTEIRYSTSLAGTVAVKIYNVLGVQVKEVLNLPFLPAGAYKETIDAAGFPAGIYFVILKAGRETLTEQIVVLR